MASKLTDAKIKGLKPPESGQAEYPDSLVPGLRVRIGKSGKPAFVLRKRVSGKLKTITLGGYDERRFGLAAARRKARILLSDIEAGRPLPAPKSERKAAATIGDLMPAYLASKQHLRSYREIERIANGYILPGLGDRVADTVTRGEVTAFVDAIDAPTMARAAHAQLSAFYSWALQRLDTLPFNPCRDAGRPAKPRSRDRVLTDDELAALWRYAETEPSPWGAGFRLLILTGKRREELFQADWAEFDLKAAEWCLPSEGVKNDTAEIVPLSAPALQILEGLPRKAKKLLPTRTKARADEAGPSGYSKALNRFREAVDKALEREPLEGKARWTYHDIRRTVATGLQRLGVRYEVTEAVLNHVSGSRGGVAGVYQRHDWKVEKREALEKWADFVLGLQAGEGRDEDH